MSRLMRSLTTLALAVLCATGAWAQSQATTGVIEGTVTDETGGVLPGATVTLRNTATNFEQVVTTGADGRFRAPSAAARTLPDHGRASTGFATLIREGIDLSVGQTINLPLDAAARRRRARRSRSPPRRR